METHYIHEILGQTPALHGHVVCMSFSGRAILHGNVAKLQPFRDLVVARSVLKLMPLGETSINPIVSWEHSLT